MGVFQVYLGVDGRFRFRLRASNGAVIIRSQAYTTKQSAIKGINAVRKASSIPGHFVRKNMKNGKYYFLVKAKNGETIGTSEGYVSETGLENGIKSVMINAPAALVKEQKPN